MALTMEAKNDDWRSVNSWWWLHWSSCPLACYQLFYSFPWWKMMPWSNLGLGAGSSTSCLMSVDSKSCVVLSCRTGDSNWRSEDTWYCDKLARARDAPRFYKYFLWSILCIYSRRGRGHKIQISTYLLTQIFMREIIHVCQTFKLSHK